MSKILNDSELQEIRKRLDALRYLYPQILGHLVLQDISAIFQHIDALAVSLDAEAAAHSVTRAALVASPEYIKIDDYNSGESWLECAHCHYTLLDGHANDCLLKVALEQAP